MSAIKDFFLNKITLRVIYIIGAFSTSHLVALLASPKVQDYLKTAGLSIQVTDAATLKTWITGLLLVAGEFIYRGMHTKVIMPIVNPKEPTKA